MGPLPYPHRATFLASTLVVPGELEPIAPYLARLLAVIVFDHFLRHPVVTLGDLDDERLTDDQDRLLDARHPQVEDSIDWLFRVSRRHEVLWLDVSVDPNRRRTTVLRARRPAGPIDEWPCPPELSLSQQVSYALAAWLAARRLPQVPKLPEFTVDDLRVAGERLHEADAALQARDSDDIAIPVALTQPPARLAIPYLRVLGDLSHDQARTLDAVILQLDPAHPVAQRNLYVAGIARGNADRRAILPVIDEAPMYGKPHLSVWGEPFATLRPVENMGVRHQGIAASLMPGNPYACHNYSLQLAEHARREESYRWADRATVASPAFGAAHLDCVRRLRQVGRPGQAFAEAQYRCREILDRAAAGRLPAAEWQAPHQAALLIAFTHLDVGRLDEAIELADAALAQLPGDAASRDAFAWARKRVAHWRTDAGLYARAYGWEGYHRGDPGRAIAGLMRGMVSDPDDTAMLLDALVTVGREEQAEIAFFQCAGLDGLATTTAAAAAAPGDRRTTANDIGGMLGDGKARLAAARALVLAGKLDDALDQLQTVQLRRSQSKLEAEINRVLRLAATHPAAEWEKVIERRLDAGALQLAQLAARDLADFVPDMDTPIVRRALGERTSLKVDPVWIAELIASVPAAAAGSPAILDRLAQPKEATLRAADALAQEWWTVLVPPARDRDAHAAGAVLALGLALANYLVAATGRPTPIAGAYRHIATEALHLVRRSRYQLEPAAVQALLRMVDYLGGAPEWLLDTWLLRIERALDLEAEHGGYLDGLTAGMPTVQRLLRGDERIGWELRMAHDLAVDPSQYEPAAMLFARCARAVEGGTVPLAWSVAATAGAPALAQLDVHWLAAMSNPVGTAGPWLGVARGLLSSGRPGGGFDAACRGIAAATPEERAPALVELTRFWKGAGIVIPLDGDAAFTSGLAAAAAGRHDLAIQHLRWAAAHEPGNPERAHKLAEALAQTGHGLDAIRVLAAHERGEAPRLVGRTLATAGRAAEAVAILRYASRRFRTSDDWAALATAAAVAGNDAVTADAGRHAIALGARDADLIAAVATALYRLGEFVECEQLALRLISDVASPRRARIAGLHAMARALAGQGRHVDAHPYAKAAGDLAPEEPLAGELMTTLDVIVGQTAPPIRASSELTMERQAFNELEAGSFDSLVAAIASPSWGITRVAIAACEFRRDEESTIPVSPRALEAALAILTRTEGATAVDAVLARIRALRLRDNAFIQIDPPPPMGTRLTADDFQRGHADRQRRPQRPSAILSAART